MKDMKKLLLIFTISILFSSMLFCQNENEKWVGKYSFEEPGPINFELRINSDNTCTYEGIGIQTYFIIECKGKINGDKYEIYFWRTKEGAYLSEDWINKSKPIMILSYSGKTLYTYEPQHDFEKKGPKKTFIKVL